MSIWGSQRAAAGCSIAISRWERRRLLATNSGVALQGCATCTALCVTLLVFLCPGVIMPSSRPKTAPGLRAAQATQQENPRILPLLCTPTPCPAAAAALSDSAGRPLSPSSAEPSPAATAAAVQRSQGPWAGCRSVHGQPPGKQPYPDDRTPEAQVLRARQQGQAVPDGAAAAGQLPGSGGGGAGGPAAAARDDAAGGPANGPAPALPRSVYAQPPGKQPHPDDPAFAPGGPAAAAAAAVKGEDEDAAARGTGPGQPFGYGAPPGVGPRSLHAQPPGKQPEQIAAIEQTFQQHHLVDNVGEGEPQSPQARAALPSQAPWRQQATPHAHAAGALSPQQQPAAAPAVPGYAPTPASSSHQARQRSAPPGAGGGAAAGGDKSSSRKRPASHAAGDGGQRKKQANGSAAAGGAAGTGGTLQRLNTGMSTSRPLSSGVPASLARTGGVGGEGVQAIRPMPGAPRSLQQRQQLLNGAIGGARPAGASRPKQSSTAAGAAAKPKQQPKGGGTGQRKSAGGGASSAAAAAAAAQYKPGDIVWAKIGVYPWWPAQLQRPSAEEHFKPKHASTDLFCVFYGGRGGRWGTTRWGGPTGAVHWGAEHANLAAPQPGRAGVGGRSHGGCLPHAACARSSGVFLRPRPAARGPCWAAAVHAWQRGAGRAARLLPAQLLTRSASNRRPPCRVQ